MGDGTSTSPLQGQWLPNTFVSLSYGPGIIEEKLRSCLPTPTSKAYIITGTSLATKTDVIKRIEAILTSTNHGGTFHGIKQHAQVAQLNQALHRVQQDPAVDTLISVGGGSPIDSAKTIIHHISEASGRVLSHIAIPTTLSAAECTDIGGTTMEDNLKTGIRHPDALPRHILYDPTAAAFTPITLFLSTGIRALDHAVELQYNADASWAPCQLLGLSAIKELFELLPKYKQDPGDNDTMTRLFLAAYSTLGFFGRAMKGSVGLSHTLGYSLGSPYSIPHGVTSCLTLGHVVKLKAQLNDADAAPIARILPYLGEQRSGDDVKDAQRVGDRILGLVKSLGLDTNLTAWGVSKDEVDTICSRAVGSWMPGEQRSAREEKELQMLRALVVGLF
ncbi:maleylacetate reductase [Dactylonectria macrodidyma]|uniref:Maleylacetate reductase n=1 Tax=Dactylonectria macrodidyma TaxID=307937 RepID=A0A9P9F9V1_9HYPO|nr:maleylacetate reductase [Dactylonectria macrodidyma]